MESMTAIGYYYYEVSVVVNNSSRKEAERSWAH